MAYPTVTFRDFLDGATLQELDQLCSLLVGYLSKEHTETGAHRDITARSLTLSANTATGATGVLTVDGNITADADGSPIIVGVLPQSGAIRPLNGIDMRTTTVGRWRIGTYASTSNERELIFEDVLGALGPFTFRIYWDGSSYVLQPEAASPLQLGKNANSERIASIFVQGAVNATQYKDRAAAATQMEVGYQTIANNGTYDLTGGAAAVGNLTVLDETGLTTAQILVRGSANAVAVISNPTSAFSTTAGNAGTTNVFWNAGTNSYRIENKTGGSRAYRLHLVGSGL